MRTIRWSLLLALVGCGSPPLLLGERITVPCNQVLTPFGAQVDFPGRPSDVALSPDGKTLAVLGHRAIVILDAETGAVRQRLDSKGPHGFSFTGIRFHEGRIFASNLSGRIDVLESSEKGWTFAEPIVLTTKPSAPGGLAFAPDGSRLYAAMNSHNQLWEIDPVKREVLRKFDVGIAPYTVVVGSDRAYVSNWGGRRPRKGDTTGPAGIGTVRVDPTRHIAEEGSVSVVDLASGTSIRETVVGPHAAGLALGSRLYVACANADQVFVLDPASDAILERIDVRPHASLLFGSSPNALALDGKRLFVSNGTNNAVAVVDVAANPSRVLGCIPAGWYPAGLLVDTARNRVVVANLKGIGMRDRKRERGWNSHDFRGSVSLFPVPTEETLRRLTPKVLENNRLTEAESALLPPRKDAPSRPVPERHGEPSPIEHVVYVIKENRTYDQILGDMAEGDGDPKLCEFGEPITPNHHALAREFVLMDRFFCSGTLSADGHQWTDEAFVTDYIEKFFGGWVRSYPYNGGDALAYSAGGFLWDNALARGKTLRIYGEFVEAKISFRDGKKKEPTYADCLEDYKAGTDKIEIRAVARIKTLEPHLCPTAIGFPLTVTDRHRADQFLREMKERGLANLSIVLLPADHTAGTKPGLPTPRSCVADNDLALGRIVEGISRSPFWPKTCIFVVEDDPQAGFDHVDGHRTVAFAISPYARRKSVVHAEYNQTSLVRTIELMLGLPPMNQMDAGATPMRDCFADSPDLAPYSARAATVPIDEQNARLDRIQDPDELRWAMKSMELPLDRVDEADEDTLNRIVWHAMKGWRTPYPEEYTVEDDD